jgi:uncharacterized protein YegL
MSVLVTVETSRTALDVELDDTIPVAELLPEITAALGAAPDAVLAVADGAPLDPRASLAAAGVLDGHRLTLLDVARSPAADVLPVYVAVDTSDSVTGPALDVLNVELGRLADAFRDDNRVSGTCRLAVLTFDAEARVVLPLTAAADLTGVPAQAATRPSTNYESVFKLLRRQIGRDLTGLRMAGLRPLRPLVVCVTDGRPTRGYWPPAHAALTDPGWEGAADILAFGVGAASDLTLRRIGTAGAYPTAGLVPPVMSFVLDALGSSSTPMAGASVETGPDGWRFLHELVR